MKIIAGMSGGVDSAVAALPLKEQGHQVSGIIKRQREPLKFSPHTVFVFACFAFICVLNGD